MYTEGEVTTSTPEKNEVILVDESAGRIELKSGPGSQDRIFKINRKSPDPDNKDCTIYITTLPLSNRQGMGCMVIIIDKFYKLIKMGYCSKNEGELKNYMEFQYE